MREIMAKQLVVFLENRPGQLAHVAQVLADDQINIRSITIASSVNFGVVKLIVDRPDQAYEALQKSGMSVNLQEVLAVVMDDQIGGLHAVLEAFAEKGLNVKDASGFVVKPEETAILITEVEDPESARQIAREAGFRLYQDELHNF